MTAKSRFDCIQCIVSLSWEVYKLHSAYTRSGAATETGSVMSQNFKFVKLKDWLAYSERTSSNSPVAKNQPVSANYWVDISTSLL